MGLEEGITSPVSTTVYFILVKMIATSRIYHNIIVFEYVCTSSGGKKCLYYDNSLKEDMEDRKMFSSVK